VSSKVRVIFLDNRDSFVYNLVDLTAREAGVQVFRNTTPVATLRDALEPTAEERAAGERPLLILSPGPGHPRQAGHMMEILDVALQEKILWLMSPQIPFQDCIMIISMWKMRLLS